MLNFFRKTIDEATSSSVHKFWDFCAPVAGISFTLSFSPFDYSYLVLPALIFLIASSRDLTPGRAFLRGYWFGLGIFGSGVSWVYVSIHDFGGAGFIASAFLTGLFVGFWALFPALALYLTAIVNANSTSIRIFTFPLFWILVEYLRGYLILNGFPWLQIAYSQLETPLAGYIPVLGVYGTGFLLALTASIAVAMFFNKQRPVLLSALLIVIWTAGSVLTTVNWTHEIGNPIRVALIQGNIAQDQKWRPENKTKTLLRYKALTEAHWDSDVIVWPETAIPAYLSEVKDEFLSPLAEAAKKHDTDLIISVPAKDSLTKEKYNAVITLGSKQGIYRKIHLLPFGEYLPWQPFSGFILQSLKIRLGNFTPGAVDQPLLSAGGYPFITSICYEDAFGDQGIKGLPGGAYLVNVTNDGWFGDTIEPYQHLQIAKMRAMETGRYLLRATNTGLTAIVSPDGKIINQAPLFTTTTLTGVIRPMGGTTPYAGFGDRPVIYFLAIMLSLLLIADNLIPVKND